MQNCESLKADVAKFYKVNKKNKKSTKLWFYILNQLQTCAMHMKLIENKI